MIARTQKPLAFRPRLVVAYADSSHAALSARLFRRLGWEVHLASSGPDARHLASMLAPQVLVLDVDLPEESGWLTCAKLALEPEAPQVILVACSPSAKQYRYARLVGAMALVAHESGVARLVSEVSDSTVAFV